MSTVTEIVTEVALLVEREPRNDFVFFMLDEALLGDRVVVTPFANERDVALLNDNFAESAYASFREVALLNDTATRSVRAQVDVRDVALLADTVAAGVVVTKVEREVALGNDTATYNVDIVLRDTAVLNDTASPKTYQQRSVRETAALLSRVVVPAGVSVRDVALVNDTAYRTTFASPLLRDVALFNDAATSPVRVDAVLREVATLADHTGTVLVTSGLIHDVAYLTDTPTPPPYGRAYTCSIASWGMSTWANFPFRTMAGTLAAGDNLWRLDPAVDDDGTPIESYITTGVLDMGASQDKRITAVYVAGSADDELTVSVIGDVNGTKQAFSYPLEVRDQTEPRNNRALVGKGFRSRFIQVKIGGTGVNYKVLAAEADVSVTSRRV